MKKNITLFILATITTIAFSQVNMPVDQSGRITYKEVFNVDISEIESINMIGSYIDTCSYIIKEQSDTLQEEGRTVISYKGKIVVYYNEKKAILHNDPTSTIGTFMKDKDVEYGYVAFDLSFMFTEGKVGYKFTNFVHKHDSKRSCGELEQRLGRNTKEFFWEGYKIQVNDNVNKLILDIKGLFRDKGMVEEW